MNALLALLLKDRISQFAYVEKLAGMVRVITREQPGGAIKIPVASNVDDTLACGDSSLRDMVPDQGYKTIVYFEDGGERRVQTRTRGISYESRLRLVCWVNTAKLNGDAYAADKIMQQFASELHTGVYNDGPFIGVRHTVDTVPIRGAGLFSAYTYPEGARQYLLHPFDAFALDIVTSYRIRPGCEDEVVIGDADCWTPPTNRRRRYPREFECDELLDAANGLTTDQLINCLNCSGTAMPQIIHKSDAAAAAADNTTIITDQQLLALDDSGRIYIGANNTPAALVAANRFMLPASEDGDGLLVETNGETLRIQLNEQ